MLPYKKTLEMKKVLISLLILPNIIYATRWELFFLCSLRVAFAVNLHNAYSLSQLYTNAIFAAWSLVERANESKIRNGDFSFSIFCLELGQQSLS